MQEPTEKPSLLEQEVPSSFNFLSLIVERYGPFAFGVILLLIVWQMVAKPQIESARIDFDQQQKLVSELGEVMGSFKLIGEQHRQTAEAFKLVGEQQRQTAEILRTTSELLSKTSDKLAQIRQ